MMRALLVAGVMAIATSASAGPYLGLALGTQPSLTGDLDATVQPGGRSWRGLAGVRFGNVSVEAAVNGFGVTTASYGARTVYQGSAAAKLSFPLGSGFEAFGRAGLERTWLDRGDERYNYQGDGFLVSGGFELRLDALLAKGSLFVDYTVRRTTLHDTRAELDATMRTWALGLCLGF